MRNQFGEGQKRECGCLNIPIRPKTILLLNGLQPPQSATDRVFNCFCSDSFPTIRNFLRAAGTYKGLHGNGASADTFKACNLALRHDRY